MRVHKLSKFLLKMILILLIIAILLFGIPRLVTYFYSRSRIYSAADVPSEPVAIVFGAGLNWDGTPSPVLKDRVQVAANLYFAGKVKKLLVSGDNRFINYNEPGAMRQYALELGVPDKDIVQDFAGRSTYDTCYRASKIFGVTQAILVTQAYHQPRALYLCNRLGVTSVGVSADLRTYERRAYAYWVIREIPATLNALWDVTIAHPLPVLGNPEPIFPNQ